MMIITKNSPLTNWIRHRWELKSNPKIKKKTTEKGKKINPKKKLSNNFVGTYKCTYTDDTRGDKKS